MVSEFDTSTKTQPSASRELFESERRFRLLVEGVVDYAICMLDPNGIITNWNMGAERIKGYSEGEIVGRHFGIFHTPEDRAAGLPAQSLQTAICESKFETEGWRVRKNGTRFFASVVIDPIYEKGALIGFAKITRDITDRQDAQVALHDSERQFQLLVNGVTDYALFMLNPEGYISSWNIGGERIKGYKPDEIIGQHFSLFYTEADRQAGRPARALATAGETGRYEEEGWRVRKDGTYFWASVIIDPLRADDGTLIGFAKITRDITERKEAQIALQNMQQQLAQAHKMDALGQLTGGVAHDFNNLLMIIVGHISSLKSTTSGDPKATRAVQAIEIAAQRGAALTRQLLTFSRRQPVNPEPIDLRERIDPMREVLKSGLGSKASLAIDIAADLWPIFVDISELEIALLNLILNARDAMPGGGSITLKAANIVIGDAHLTAGEYVAISVVDTGGGIPADVIERVFDPFFTTKPVGKGTGLGLSQVHGFAHQAGGAVSVSSVLDQGTTVTISLPRHSEATAKKLAQVGDENKSAGTVLLVEDNPDVAEASTALIEQLGFSVRWARGANAALQELETIQIDLVFSDIVMPGERDGLELAYAIRQKYPSVPILLATGYSEAAHRVQADFPILRKPYQIHELSEAFSKATRQHSRSQGLAANCGRP